MELHPAMQFRVVTKLLVPEDTYCASAPIAAKSKLKVRSDFGFVFIFVSLFVFEFPIPQIPLHAQGVLRRNPYLCTALYRLVFYLILHVDALTRSCTICRYVFIAILWR